MDQEQEHKQMQIETEIGKTFKKLYDLLLASDKIEAEEALGCVAEGKARWEADKGSFDGD